jgi:hypothetical protein
MPPEEPLGPNAPKFTPENISVDLWSGKTAPFHNAAIRQDDPAVKNPGYNPVELLLNIIS